MTEDTGPLTDHSKDGIDAARDFTKLIITLSSAGIAFVVSRSNTLNTEFQKISALSAVVFLALAIGAGLLVLMQAATNLSQKNYALDEKNMKWPGIVSVFSLFIGVIALASLASSLLFSF